MSKISHVKLPVGEQASGQAIVIDKFVIDSGKSGKTVYIQGGIHGGEVTLPIFIGLFDYIKNNLIMGKVVMIPFCNPIAWQQQSYCYTVGKFSNVTGKDFNRAFGKKVMSLSDKNMEVLSEEIKKSDFVIDLHTASNSIPFAIINKKEYLKYADIANLKYTYFCPQCPAYDGTTDDIATNNNIPNITIECGSHDSINKEHSIRADNAILLILQELKMLKEKIIIPKEECLYFENPKKFKTMHAGIIDFKKQPGDKVKKDDLLYEVYSANLEKEVIKVTADFDGILLKHIKTHIYNQYNETLEVIMQDDLKKI